MPPKARAPLVAATLPLGYGIIVLLTGIAGVLYGLARTEFTVAAFSSFAVMWSGLAVGEGIRLRRWPTNNPDFGEKMLLLVFIGFVVAASSAVPLYLSGFPICSGFAAATAAQTALLLADKWHNRSRADQRNEGEEQLSYSLMAENVAMFGNETGEQQEDCCTRFLSWCLWLLAATLVLLQMGACYQSIGNAVDARSYPQPHVQLVAVDDTHLQLHCVGKASDKAPTVLLEAAIGWTMLEWTPLLDALAANSSVHACAYNRAGYAGSAPGPQPRDSAQLVEEMRVLMDAAGIKPPIIIAGHAFGGLIAQTYTTYHPHDVASLLLIDSSSPTQLDALATGSSAAERKEAAAAGLKHFLTQLDFSRFAAPVGYARLTALHANFQDLTPWTAASAALLPPTAQLQLNAYNAMARSMDVIYAESLSFQASASALASSEPNKPWGDVPVTVLYGSSTMGKHAPAWVQLQDAFLNKSSNACVASLTTPSTAPILPLAQPEQLARVVTHLVEHGSLAHDGTGCKLP